MAKFNIGNRIKCMYVDRYSETLQYVRGEILDIKKDVDGKVVFVIAGYDNYEPYKVRIVNIPSTKVREMGGTRLDKPRSENLTQYVKILKEKIALSNRMKALEEQEKKLQNTPIKRSNIPYTKNEIVRETYEKLWNNKDYAPYLNGFEKDTINLAVPLLKNQRSSKHLKIHSVAGSVWMDDFEQKDIHNHLAESSSVIRGFINVFSLEDYFTVSQRLFVDMDFEGRPTFDVGVSMRLKAKDTIREEDINYIVGLFYNIMKYAKD